MTWRSHSCSARSTGWRSACRAKRYLVGDRITEADWRLFPDVDALRHGVRGHFKCNRNRIAAHANLWAYTRELYQRPGIAETVDMDHIKRHYYMTHPSLNPSRVVPAVPGSTSPNRTKG